MTTFFVLLLVFFAAGGVFWAWWAVPKDRVPPHLSPDDLKRLETEDKLRQTNYQMLAGGALVLTFSLTVYQAATSYNQWTSDYQLRNRQAEVTHLSEALKALSLDHAPAARVAGFYSLRQLAVQYPEEEALLVNGVLSSSVRAIASNDPVGEAKPSHECGSTKLDALAKRDEPDPEVQVAMKILGDPLLARLRASRFSAKACQTKAGTTSLATVTLSHLALDNLDLNGADYSCLDFTQSSFRRTNLRASALQGANFSGATFDDWRTPGFNEKVKVVTATDTKRAEWLYSDSNENRWQRYRCWIADFRGANLTGAQFNGSGLSGADFRHADLTDASFEGANISRANFRESNVQADQLMKACAGAGDLPLLDPRMRIQVRTCE